MNHEKGHADATASIRRRGGDRRDGTHRCDEFPTRPDEAGTYFGPSESLGNGQVRTYVELDGDGTPSEMGVAITEDAFSGLPTGPEPLQLVLTFADEAEQTPFQHVLFD